MWWNKKKPKVSQDRTIPRADISGFVPPELIKVTEHKKSDMDVVSKLRSELTRTGVIDRHDDSFGSIRSQQTSSDIDSIISRANRAAQSERDFNSAFYDADTTSFLEDRNTERVDDDEENPFLRDEDDHRQW